MGQREKNRNRQNLTKHKKEQVRACQRRAAIWVEENGRIFFKFPVSSLLFCLLVTFYVFDFLSKHLLFFYAHFVVPLLLHFFLTSKEPMEEKDEKGKEVEEKKQKIRTQCCKLF